MPKRRIVENSTNSVDVNQQVIIAPSRRDQGAINRKNAERKKEEQLLLRNRIKGLEKENKALVKAKENLAILHAAVASSRSAKEQVVKENRELLVRNDALQLELLQLQRDINNLNRRCLQYESRQNPDEFKWAAALKMKGFPETKKETNCGALKDLVAKSLLALMAVAMACTQPLSRLRVIVNVLFEQCIFGIEETRFMVMRLARKYTRGEVYKPWKILKAMDLAPKGALNYTGLEVLRSVEGLGRYEQGLIPARSTIQKQARRLYEVGQIVIPIERVECPLGEMYQFHFEKKLRLILKTFGLEQIASQAAVEICITLDGAELCDYLSHLTAGVKIVDKRAIDPRTKLPLCTVIDDVLGETFSCQSRNNCFIFKSMIGKDTKEAYGYFQDFFEFFDKVKREGLPASPVGPAIHPMLVWSPQDLSSLWKTLKTGTGAKKNSDSYFCHVCPCSSRDILFYKVGNNRCDRCVRKGNTKCYHWSVGDEATIENFQRILRAELGDYIQLIGATVEDIRQRSRIKYNPNAIDKETDINNIEFVLSTEDDTDADMEQVFYFNTLLNEELQLRNMPLDGTLGERRERLKNQLAQEERILLMQKAIERSEQGKEAALMLIHQAIPCIMHLENRSGEKILTMLLSVGADHYQRHRGGASLDGYVKEVQRIVQTIILGTEWRPKQWRVPMKEKGDEIGKVSLSNSTTRQFMSNCYPLIDYIFSRPEDAELRTKWRDTITLYNSAIDLLRKPTIFSDDEIEEFQTLVDDFYKHWIELVGREGITNYIHMLGSGHIAYYLQVHRNLYKFSQQNWESLNEKMKVTYFRNTQRGGNWGKNEREGSYLLSVIKVFQRELLWLSGIGDETFT